MAANDILKKTEHAQKDKKQKKDLQFFLHLHEVKTSLSNWSLTRSRLSVRTPDVYVNPKREQYERNPLRQRVQQFKRFIENYRRHIVCFIVVYAITAGLCLERCYCRWSCCVLL